MGCSRTKQGRGGFRIHLFYPPWKFSFFYFTPGNSKQNKAQPLDIPQDCVRSLGNSKAKNKDCWKFHIIFSWLRLEIPLRFELAPGNSTCSFDNPWKIHILNPPCLDFSGIAQFCLFCLLITVIYLASYYQNKYQFFSS